LSFLFILGIALALAMDALAVSLGLGLSLRPARNVQTFRLAFSFGLFQFAMLILGWAAGGKIVQYISRFDHWLAFALLLGVGGNMIFESLNAEEALRAQRADPTRGISLLVLSVATSLDALAVGISLGTLRVAVAFPAAVVGIVAFIMTVVGMKIGPALGKVIGRRAELLGGAVLILIGIKILTEHL
jgi:putative Mn2+ efflux pump MntP